MKHGASGEGLRGEFYPYARPSGDLGEERVERILAGDGERQMMQPDIVPAIEGDRRPGALDLPERHQRLAVGDKRRRVAVDTADASATRDNR